MLPGGICVLHACNCPAKAVLPVQALLQRAGCRQWQQASAAPLCTLRCSSSHLQLKPNRQHSPSPPVLSASDLCHTSLFAWLHLCYPCELHFCQAPLRASLFQQPPAAEVKLAAVQAEVPSGECFNPWHASLLTQLHFCQHPMIGCLPSYSMRFYNSAATCS